MIPKVQFNSDMRKHESQALPSDLISPVSIHVHHTVHMLTLDSFTRSNKNTREGIQ